MASITNNHRMTLRLADGTVLKPGEATEVAGWDKQSKNKTVAGWVSAGLLSVDGKAKAADKPDGGAVDGGKVYLAGSFDKEVVAKEVKKMVDADVGKAGDEDDKATLKAKLDELGIEYDGRASVAKLRELLADHEG